MNQNIGQELLLEILNHNQKTDYGKRFDFSTIKTIKEYQEKLPLTTYKDYKPMINLLIQLREKNIFSADEIKGYFLSFDEKREERYIPYTQKYMELYTKWFDQTVASGRILSLCTNFPETMKVNGGKRLDSLTGVLLMECRKSKKFKGTFTSPNSLLYPKAAYDYRYVRALFALANNQVSLLVAPYMGIVKDFCEFICDNWEFLVEDIEKGTITNHENISEKLWIPEEMRVQLSKYLKPLPVRAKRLRKIFEKGVYSELASKIWPDLSLIVAAESGMHVKKDHVMSDEYRMKCYTGNIPVNYGLYCMPEALIGISVANDNDEKKLIPEAGFFEFIPAKNGVCNTDEICTMQDVEAGQVYELVITNCLGLYRYRLGDIIKIERLEDGIPVVTVLYKNNASIPFNRDENEVVNHKRMFDVISEKMSRDFTAHI